MPYQIPTRKWKIKKTSQKTELTPTLKSIQLILQFLMIPISPTNQMKTSEMIPPIPNQTRTSSKL